MSEAGDRSRAALRRASLVAAGEAPGPLLGAGAEEWRALDIAEARDGIQSVLMGRFPDRGLDRLHDEGALDALLPEVVALVGFGEGGRQHKDVWNHTKRVVLQSPPAEVVRWAALLHDIGKVPTRRTSPTGEVTFHGHAEVGARMARDILKRLRVDRALADRVCRLVLHHLRANQYDPSWTDSAVRRFGKEVGEILEPLLDLSRADMTTRYEDKRRRGLDLIDDLGRRVAAIREQDARVPPLPKDFGNAVIRHFGLPPGPRIGVLRRAVEEAIEEDQLEPFLDAAIYLQWLEEHLDEI